MNGGKGGHFFDFEDAGALTNVGPILWFAALRSPLFVWLIDALAAVYFANLAKVSTACSRKQINGLKSKLAVRSTP
jgi:hypothetical protein